MYGLRQLEQRSWFRILIQVWINDVLLRCASCIGTERPSDGWILLSKEAYQVYRGFVV